MENTWYQQSLTPPRVLEVRFRLGVVPESDHAQALAEMVDPTTGIQIAMKSWPHVTLHGLDRVIEEASGTAKAWLNAEIAPF